MTDESIAAELSDEQLDEVIRERNAKTRGFNGWGFKVLMRDAIAADRALRASPEVIRASSGSLSETALDCFNRCWHEEDGNDPVERLRFFCAKAMNGQDWIDVEEFFDALSPKGWISVEDHLPAVGEEVLLNIPNSGNGKNGFHILVAKRELDGCFVNTLDTDFGETWPPTHWMPLPEAPSVNQSDFRGLKRDEGPTADAATGTAIV